MINFSEMKLDNSGKESTMSQQQQQQDQQQKPPTRRLTSQSQPIEPKPIDIKDQKEKLKQEKLRKEKEQKEREKQEKLQKEKEKKEKKEREKLAKKTNSASPALGTSSTTSGINRITNEASPNLPQSTSDNVLSKLKLNQQIMQQQQIQTPSIPKGRYRCQVVYLDESVKNFDVDKNALGDDLMALVCQDLEIVEKEYFSLTYRDVNNMKFWLDHEKKIKSQLKGNVTTEEPVFNFEVKFYPPEPNVLQEEITRYLLTLQLRHDIMDGELPCTFVTHALLGSYTVQAELGDYDELTNTTNRLNINGLTGFDYLEGFCFAPNQTPELLAAIANCHKDNKGQPPAEAEMHYLENAVKLAMYGVDLHNAKDSDGVDILIGVSASGLLVFRDHLRINRFAWPKILKISYKRNHFYLKLRPGEFEKYETTIGFRCPNHKAAKRLWKIAVEHHAFFRLREPEKPTTRSRLLPNFNSNFRYTGSSTYMQSRTRSIERNQPEFTRSLSKRLTQSMDRGLAMENPNGTPGSVQSAAFNHFNRMKPHMSTSNLQRQNVDLRESQEDLDEGDYNVNDSNKFNTQFKSASNRVPTTGGANPKPAQSGLKKLIDRIPTDSANLSTRSNDSNTPSGMYQAVNKKPSQQQFNQNLPNMNMNNTSMRQQETDSFEPLDEYYTSVDNNMAGDDNRTPSTKRSIADSISAMSGSNKISTPILNNPNQQQQQQRYVPSRQINQPRPTQQQQQQQQLEYDEPPVRNNQVDMNSSLTNPPRSTNSSYLSQSSKRAIAEPRDLNDSIQHEISYLNDETDATNSSFQSKTRPSQHLIKPINNTFLIADQRFQQNNLNKSPQQSYSNSNVFKSNDQISSTNSSYRNLPSPLSQPKQQTPPPPPPAVPQASNRTVNMNRPQPPPPPVPADRLSVNSRDRLMSTQQQRQLIEEQEYENQRALIEQQEYELKQQEQTQKIRELREQQYRQQQQFMQRQATASSASIRANEASRSGSIISTPNGSSRIRKEIMVNEVNHKDLLLQAIQMATELDPNLEVEKVEITTED